MREVEALLAAGADREAQARHGMTPLLVALDYGHEEAALVLLRAGASTAPHAAAGDTALHLAARDGAMQVLEILLRRGVAPDVRSSSQRTPLHAAAKYDRVEAIARLLRAGADVDAVADDAFAPLHVACAEGHLGAATQLLAAKARLDLRTRGGETALHWAVFANRPIEMHIYERLGQPHKTTFIPQREAKLVELLLARGAAVDALDDQKNTPLHKAAMFGAEPAVRALLARGASKTARNGEGLLAHELASRRGNSAIAALLR